MADQTNNSSEVARLLFGGNTASPAPKESSGVASLLFGGSNQPSQDNNVASMLFSKPQPQAQSRPSSDPSTPWYKKVWDWANEPVIDESQVEGFLGDSLGLGHSGWTKGFADLLAGFTSPLSIGLTVASLPFGGEGGVIGSLVDSGGATALREAAGFGAEEINAFTKTAHLMQDAVRTGKASTEAEAISEAIANGSTLAPERISQGLQALKESGVTAESLMSNGVIRRTASAMFRKLGASVGTAENFGRWTQVAADAGFTTQAALGAVTASPRVLDAIKDGDYESAKRFAVDALGGAAFATLGSIGLRHEAGGLWSDIRSKYGLNVVPSEENLKLINEFGNYDEMTKTLGLRFDNWLKDFREQNKDLTPDDLHRMMKWIQSDRNPRTMAMRYNWLAEAAGRPDRIPVPAEPLTPLGTPQKFNFSIPSDPAQYEKFQEFKKKYQDLTVENEQLSRQVDEKLAEAKTLAGGDQDKYNAALKQHLQLLQGYSKSAKEIANLQDELEALDPRVGNLRVSTNGDTMAMLSDRAMKLLSSVAGINVPEGAKNTGVSFGPHELNGLVQRLANGSYENESDRAMSEQLSNLLQKASQTSGNKGVAIAATRGMGIRATIDALREELLHNWQRSLGNGWVEDHLKPEDFTSLAKDLPPSMVQHLTDLGYEKNDAQFVVEAAAKIMSGFHKMSGTSDVEAAQWLSKYFEAIKKTHGDGAVKQINHTFGIAKRVQEGFVKLYEDSKSTTEKELSKARPSDEFVRGMGTGQLAGGSEAASGQQQRRQLPTVEDLVKKFGTTPFVSQAGFVAGDGRMIPLVGEHDRMLGATPKDNVREPFINQTGVMRARRRTGPAGNEMVFSVPENGITDQQVAKIQDAAEILHNGRISIEVARPGGRYDVIDNPTPGKVVQSLENIFGTRSNLGFAEEAAKTMQDTGGFTFNPRDGRVTKGFAFEILPEYRKVLDHTIKPSDIRNFYLEHKSLFDSNPELHIGGFENEINISATTPDRALAEKMAARLDQKSIADLSKIPASGAPPDEAFINTGGKGESRSFPNFPESQRLQALRSEPPFGQSQKTPLIINVSELHKYPESTILVSPKGEAFATEGYDPRFADSHESLFHEIVRNGNLPEYKDYMDELDINDFYKDGGIRVMYSPKNLHVEIENTNPEVVNRAISLINQLPREKVYFDGGQLNMPIDKYSGTPKRFSTTGSPKEVISQIQRWARGEMSGTGHAPGFDPSFLGGQQQRVASTVGLLNKPLLKGQHRVDEIAQKFQEWSRDKAMPMLDATKVEPEKMTARATAIASHEIRRQLAQENSGANWYSHDVGVALDELAKLHPELTNDPVRRQFVLALGAAASLGNDSPSAVKLMDEIYSLYKETGKVPATRANGADWGSEHSNANRFVLQNLQRIIERNNNDIGQAMDWMMSKHPLSEVNEMKGRGKHPGKATDMVYGAYALAPKAGSFFLNMNGIPDVITMDKWFMRSWNRWMGTLVNKDGSVNEKPPTPRVREIATQSFKELADQFGLTPSQAQAVMWFYEQNLWKAHGADIKAGDSYANAARDYVGRKLQSRDNAENSGRTGTEGQNAGDGIVRSGNGQDSSEVSSRGETDFNFGKNRIGQAQLYIVNGRSYRTLDDAMNASDRASHEEEKLPKLNKPVVPFAAKDRVSAEYLGYPESEYKSPESRIRTITPKEEKEWKEILAKYPLGQAQKTSKPTKPQSTDEARIRELIDAHHVKNRLTGPEIDKLLDSYDYRKMTDRHKDVAKTLSDKFADNFAFAEKNKVLAHAIQNYVTQYWQNDKSGEAANRIFQKAHTGGFAVNSSMARHRVFQNAFEGELMGRKLAYTDPALLAAHNGNEFGRIVAARKVIENIADKGYLASDGMPMVALKGSGHVVEGEEGENPAVMVNPDAIRSIRIGKDMVEALKKSGKLDHFLEDGKIIEYKDKNGNPLYSWDVSGYRTVDHPTMHKWMWATQDTKGNNVLMRSEMMVHPEAYDYINRRLGVEQSTIGKTAIGKGLLKVGREAKGMLLFGSPFHMIQEGLRAVMTGVSPFGLERIDLDKDPLLGKLVNNGLTIGKDYKNITAFEDSKMGGHSKIIEKIPGANKMQSWLEDFLFDKYIPSLKVRAARSLYERYKNAYPEWSDAKVSAVTAADTNERFGGINYARLGRSVATQDWFRLAALAPDWLESEVRFMGRTFGTEGKIARRDVARIAAGLWIAARVINELSTGNPHFEALFGVAHKDKEGNEKIYSVRTLPTDMFHAISDPGNFLAGRVSPLMRTATETISGRDEFGKKLPSHGLMLPAEAFIRSSAPIPAQSIAKSITGEGPELSSPDQAVKALGGTAFVYKTEASKLAAELASERSESGPVDPSKMRHHQLVQRMEDDMRTGQMQLGDLNKLVEEGSLSVKDAKDISKNVRDTQGMDTDTARLWSRASRLDMASFLRVWDLSTNNEKAALAKLLTRKRQSYFKKMLSEATPQERLSDPTYQRLRQLFPQESLF